jgi:hypothetical protein
VRSHTSVCHSQFTGLRGTGHRRGDAKDRTRPDHGDQALSYWIDIVDRPAMSFQSGDRPLQFIRSRGVRNVSLGTLGLSAAARAVITTGGLGSPEARNVDHRRRWLHIVGEVLRYVDQCRRVRKGKSLARAPPGCEGHEPCSIGN